MGSLKPTAQGFICFLTGDAVRDNEIRLTTKWLNSRAARAGSSMVVYVKEKSGAAEQNTFSSVRLLLDDLASEKGGNTRLYLNGHGDHHHHTIGGWKAADVAALLGTAVRTSRIRVLACRAGRGTAALGALEAQLQNSVNGFAGQLCRALALPGLEIHANMYAQAVEQEVFKDAAKTTILSKFARDETGAKVDRMSHSTVVFRFAGGNVVSEWKQHAKRV